MKIALACFVVCLFAVSTQTFTPPDAKQGQNFTEKLPTGIKTDDMEKSVGVIRNGETFISYEIYNKPQSQYYNLIRYKIQHLGFVVFGNEPKTDEEGLQFIESWRGTMFLLQEKSCWKKLWVFGRCKSWHEIRTREEKIRVAQIIGAILKDNLRHVKEKEIMNNQDPAH